MIEALTPAFARATEQHATGHDNRHAARLGLHRLDHVQNEDVITLVLGSKSTLR